MTSRAERRRGPKVVWSHDFTRSNAEVDNFLRESHAHWKELPDGRLSANRDTVHGVNSDIHHARRIPDPTSPTGWAVEIRVLGARLAKDIGPDDQYITIACETPGEIELFPDPDNDPRRYYWLSIHADADHPQYMPEGCAFVRKGWKELVGVTKRTGNVLHVVRGIPYSEAPSTGGTGPKAFRAGCPVGVDAAGGWERPLSALDGVTNGKGDDDPAAGGTLPIRSHAPRDGFQRFGYYSHPWYATHPEFAKLLAERDGEDFWLAWDLFIDPRRTKPGHKGGKMWFVVGADGGGLQQVVGTSTDVRGHQIRLYSDLGTEDYGVANTRVPWPTGVWFTCLMHIRPGLTKDAKVPHPASNGGDDTADSLVVLTDRFIPINATGSDGVQRLQFETALPPLFRYYPTDFNRHSPGYFNRGWSAEFPRDGNFRGDNWVPGGSSLRVERAEVVGDRMRWSLVKGAGTKPMTQGVPFAGAQLQARALSVNTAYPPQYRTQELEFWVKLPGEAPRQIYDVHGYCIPYGSGWNKFGAPARLPPAYSHFMPTGYSNVWDNLAPPPECTFIRFTDVICSQAAIPFPD